MRKGTRFSVWRVAPVPGGELVDHLHHGYGPVQGRGDRVGRAPATLSRTPGAGGSGQREGDRICHPPIGSRATGSVSRAGSRQTIAPLGKRVRHDAVLCGMQKPAGSGQVAVVHQQLHHRPGAQCHREVQQGKPATAGDRPSPGDSSRGIDFRRTLRSLGCHHQRRTPRRTTAHLE